MIGHTHYGTTWVRYMYPNYITTLEAEQISSWPRKRL